MATANEQTTETRPYVPPISPEALARQNAKMVDLLDQWDAEADDDEDRRVMAALEKALGPDRSLSSGSVF